MVAAESQHREAQPAAAEAAPEPPAAAPGGATLPAGVTCLKELHRYQPPAAEDESAYRQAERRYRIQRVPVNRKRTRFKRSEPDLSEAIDFHTLTEGDPRVRELTSEEADVARICTLGGADPATCKVYALRDRPGFFYIRGALGEAAQARWAYTCLARFSRSRHTNLTNLRGAAAATEGGGGDEPLVWAAAVAQQQEDQRQQQDGDAPLKTLRALRWANLGLNYIWTLRRYAADVHTAGAGAGEGEPATAATAATAAAQHDEGFHRIPPSLQALARAVVAALPPGNSSGRFAAEAGIVNYYPSDASMGGHVDDAEAALAQPIVSFSLGLGGLYLLGGPTRDVPPVPLVFRSGDGMVMGGQARLCYHGVPCILTESARPPPVLLDPAWLLAARFWEGPGSDGDEEHEAGEREEREGSAPNNREAEAALLARYLASSRINFNVRQVWVKQMNEN